MADGDEKDEKFPTRFPNTFFLVIETIIERAL